MKAQPHSKPGAKADESQDPVSSAEQASRNRRFVIRGAAAALPTILTLHSGAALARSSNLISATIEVDPTGPNRCIALADVTRADGTPADGTLADGKYDLGERPAARVTEFRSGQLYATDAGGINLVTPLEICSNPEVAYYVSIDGGQSWSPLWSAVNPPIEKGFLVSATAWSSFALNPTRVI